MSKANQTQCKKEKRAATKESTTQLREYEATRLPAAWRNLVRDLSLLPDNSGRVPDYSPSRLAAKAGDRVDWAVPAWWRTDDEGDQ